MTLTPHGHHILGTPLDNNKRVPVQNCGDFRHCIICKYADVNTVKFEDYRKKPKQYRKRILK
jgi:hypothetical protein